MHILVNNISRRPPYVAKQKQILGLLKLTFVFQGLEWFYLSRETGNNDLSELVTNKQKKTIELVHA